MNKISLVFIAAATFVTGCLGYGDPSLTGTGGEGGDTGNDVDVIEATCVPNETKACLCGPGSVGQQTCEEDGTSYGPCEFCASETPITGTGGDGNIPSVCQPGLEYACIIGGEPGFKVCLSSGGDYGPCTPRLHCTPGATQCCVADNGRAGVQTCDDDGKWNSCEPFDEPEGTGGTTGTGGNSGTGGNVETGGNSGTGGTTPVQGQVEYILRAVVSADVADYVRNVEFQGMLNRVGWRTFCGTNPNARPEPEAGVTTKDGGYECRFSALPGSILTSNVKVQYEAGVTATLNPTVHDAQSWACWEDWEPPCSQGSGCYKPSMLYIISRSDTDEVVEVSTSGDWSDDDVAVIWNQRPEGGCNVEVALP